MGAVVGSGRRSDRSNCAVDQRTARCHSATLFPPANAAPLGFLLPMNAVLQPAEIIQISDAGNWLQPILKTLRRLPPPMLDVAVREREVGALTVAIRRHIDPKINAAHDAEGGINNIVFMHVDENEQFPWRGIVDFRVG